MLDLKDKTECCGCGVCANICPKQCISMQTDEEGFLYPYIEQSQCVFTDSFHGLAFSINFGKNFYVFNRDDQSGPNSMNARITDTLDTFGLAQRHITGKNAVLDNASLDFTHAHQILEQEKEKSINWLLNALKD